MVYEDDSEIMIDGLVLPGLVKSLEVSTAAEIEEQEVVLLMDRFGYAKTVDLSVYVRNKDAADSENK